MNRKYFVCKCLEFKFENSEQVVCFFFSFFFFDRSLPELRERKKKIYMETGGSEMEKVYFCLMEAENQFQKSNSHTYRYGHIV